uniref:Distal-less homeobox protein 5a n=1 Tax=Gongylonema pulchrum TaxID=637853 RepID=A0A183ENI3_9BILA
LRNLSSTSEKALKNEKSQENQGNAQGSTNRSPSRNAVVTENSWPNSAENPTPHFSSASSTLSPSSTAPLSLHQMALPPAYPHHSDLNSYIYSSHQYYQQMLDSGAAAAAYNNPYNSYQAAAAASAYGQNHPASAYSAHSYFFGPR